MLILPFIVKPKAVILYKTTILVIKKKLENTSSKLKIDSVLS